VELEATSRSPFTLSNHRRKMARFFKQWRL